MRCLLAWALASLLLLMPFSSLAQPIGQISSPYNLRLIENPFIDIDEDYWELSSPLYFAEFQGAQASLTPWVSGSKDAAYAFDGNWTTDQYAPNGDGVFQWWDGNTNATDGIADPVLGPDGLYVQGEATNYLTEPLENWTLNSLGTPTDDGTVYPDGQTHALSMIGSNGDTNHNWELDNQAVTNGTTYTVVAYYKPTNYARWCRIRVDGYSAGWSYFSTQDLSTTPAGNREDAWIEPWTNGWYRVVFVFTADTDSVKVRLYPAEDDGDFNIDADGEVLGYFWHPTMNEGSLPLFSAPTNGTAVATSSMACTGTDGITGTLPAAVKAMLEANATGTVLIGWTPFSSYTDQSTTPDGILSVADTRTSLLFYRNIRLWSSDNDGGYASISDPQWASGTTYNVGLKFEHNGNYTLGWDKSGAFVWNESENAVFSGGFLVQNDLIRVAYESDQTLPMSIGWIAIYPVLLTEDQIQSIITARESAI